MSSDKCYACGIRNQTRTNKFLIIFALILISASITIMFVSMQLITDSAQLAIAIASSMLMLFITSFIVLKIRREPK